MGGETLTVRFCLHPWQVCGLLGIKEASDVQRRHFFTREVVVKDHQIIVPYVESSKNLADFFTKPMKTASKFYDFRRKIMNEPH